MSSAESEEAQSRKSTTAGEPIAIAARKGDYTTVSDLIRAGANINARSPPPLGKFNSGKAEVLEVRRNGKYYIKVYGDKPLLVGVYMIATTALQTAAENGHLEVVKLLIDKEANINAPPAKYGGRTALQAAAEGGHQEIVKLLIEKEADINAPPTWSHGRTALQAAAEGGHQETVKLLIEKEANINARPADLYGRTAIQAAAEGGHQETVKFLIEKEADINARPADLYGRTAIQAAAGGGHQEIVKLLIEKEADVNAPPVQDSGRTALQAAAEGGHQETVKFLIEKEADINAPPAEYSGRTALQAAAEGGHQETVRFLIEKEADINTPPAQRGGRTALQAAAEGGHQETVKFLIEKEADINAPPVQDSGRTALQAAAEGGHQETVKFLIEKEADVNAPPAEYSGRTALQAAAGGGHQETVKFLIEKEADINAPPAWSHGRTALQAAAEGGHQETVRFLIEKEADVNAPPATYGGRTALQAAAEGRHQETVKFLIEKEADINAPPAQDSGRTALQAAAEGGHQETVKFLIEKEADVNAPPATYGGRTALQVAADSRNAVILKTLLEANVNIHEKDRYGQTIIHQACSARDLAQLEFLLESAPFDINSRDSFGSTPLHIAVREKKFPLVERLMQKSVRMDIKDNSGETPVQVALGNGAGKILDLLLERGDGTNELGVDNLRTLLRKRDDAHDTVIICAYPNKRRIFKGMNHSDTIYDLKDLESRSRSIYLLPATCDADYSIGAKTLVEPWNFLSSYYYTHPKNTLEGTLVEWKWLTITRGYSSGQSQYGRFVETIPSNQHILSLKPSNVILISYVCFHVPNNHKGAVNLENESDNTTTSFFNFNTKKVEVSWIMGEFGDTHKNVRRSLLRSMHYRGTLNLKYISVPNNGVEFFTWFVIDIHERWLKLLEEAKVHLSRRRKAQLVSGGKNAAIIDHLLHDSQQWSELRIQLENHISQSNHILSKFETHDVLYTELFSYNDDTKADITPESALGGGGRVVEATKEHNEVKASEEDTKRLSIIQPDEEDPKRLKAIVNLSNKIQSFGNECERTISRLQQETKEMIELEFNLVSIYEARRSIQVSETSIEMAKASNSMSMSMKRLSWVTFFFLPLTFVSGLFGMNVNILSNNPSWVWYIPASVLVLTIVLLVWLLFKYVDISGWVETNIGSRLERTPKIKEKSTLVHGDPSRGPRDHIPDTSDTGSTARAPAGNAVILRRLTHWPQRREDPRRRDEEDRV